MTKIKATYLGDLRVECLHEQSGSKIITDAPLDNKGKGEAFSPTDLCATALGSCMLTIAGIYCKENNIDITGTTIEIGKEMSANPRRIGQIDIIFNMPDRVYTKKEMKVIEKAAISCPVHATLHPDVKLNFTFNWKE
ncbi:MAG: OsmC family protein [Marinifilaceae bacterium]|jgi:uncharacterized OsmC-like protein|nr:OsmC family peroxiredoxin [Marinilabiliaceae bacterium JC040]MCT4600410.1 OsmC family protein [Marinifilaceae bacterium]